MPYQGQSLDLFPLGERSHGLSDLPALQGPDLDEELGTPANEYITEGIFILAILGH